MKVVIIGSGAQGTGLAGLLVMEKDVEQLFSLTTVRRLSTKQNN